MLWMASLRSLPDILGKVELFTTQHRALGVYEVSSAIAIAGKEPAFSASRSLE